MPWISALLITLWVLFYYTTPIPWATAVLALLLGAYTVAFGLTLCSISLWVGFLLLFIPLNIPFIRRQLISRWIFKLMKGALPPMSQTEREALEAGNTWWDAELFSGNPNWKVLQDLPVARLTDEEQAFIDGPVETLCAMLNDWDITHNRKDLPKAIWDYIKQQKFCGMIIPKEYGGTGIF